MEASGKKIKPVFEEVGFDPGLPEVIEVHNVIRRGL